MKKVAMIIVFISLSFLIGCAVLDTLANASLQGAEIAKKVLPNTNWTATLLAGMIGVFGFYKKFRADKKVKAVVEGVESIRHDLFELWANYKKKKDLPSWDEFSNLIDNAMRTKAMGHQVYLEMQKEVKKVRKRRNTYEG